MATNIGLFIGYFFRYYDDIAFYYLIKMIGVSNMFVYLKETQERTRALGT